MSPCSKLHCFWARTWGVLTQGHCHMVHFQFCPQLCLEFVVKVLDVELVCEALQVSIVEQPWGCI